MRNANDNGIPRRGAHSGAPANYGVPAGHGSRSRHAAPSGGARVPAQHWDVDAAGGFGSAFGESQGFQEYSRARYGQRMMASRSRGKRRLWTVVLAVASFVLVACLATLAFIAWGYYSGTKTYNEVAKSANVAKEANALAEMTVDWDALYEQNPDTVGWIYMPGTSIDYPIVQGDTDDEYLQKDFTGESGGLVHKGSIFLSAVNQGDFSDDNNLVYGHNMNDDTMFAHVLEMAKQEVFDAARTFYVFTPTQNYRCSTFALDVVPNTETTIIQPNFADEAAMASYMTARIDASSVAVPDDMDLASFSKIFSLITCGDDYATTRAVLFGGVVESAVPANAEAAFGTVADGADAGDADASESGGQA